MKNVLILILSLFSLVSFGQDNGIRVYNVRNYGAKGDGKVVYDCVTTSGSATITSATAAFTSTAVDAGKIVHIDSAGGSHARFTDTILSITNSTTAVLKHNASFSTTVQMMDYGTDDVPGIQAAMNAASLGGGGVVYLPNPVGQFYDLASPYVTSVDGINPNCQLYIPLDSFRSSGKTIELRGEEAPFYPESGQLAVAAIPPWRGAVLYSTVTSGSGSPSIIGSSYFFTSFSNSNFATGVFTNLCVRAYNGWKGHPVAGNRNGIDRSFLSKSYCDQLMIDHSCPPESSIAPLATTGLMGSLIFNFAEHFVGRVFLVGWNTAYTMGEHEHGEYITINTALKGVTPLYGVAGVNITTLQCESMSYGVYIPSGTLSNNLNIGNWYPEHDTNPAWCPYVQDVFIDPTVNRVVTIQTAQIGGNPGTFLANDNTKVKVLNIGNGAANMVDLDHSLQTVVDAGTVTVDLFGGRQIYWTLGGNRTIAFTNISAGDKFVLTIAQDGTGGRSLTYPIGSQVVGAINGAAGSVSIINGFYDGTKYYFNVWGAGSVTQQTLPDSTTIQWPISGNSVVATVHMTKTAANTSRNINISGASAPTIVQLKVFHDSVGTSISLPGRYAFNFQWGSQQNDATIIRGLYDGTEWSWSSDVYPDNTDPVVVSYVNAVVAAGGTVSSTQKGYLNTFISSLKANSIYTKIYAMYFPVWGSAAADVYNIVNTGTFQLTFNGSWTHVASGVTPDGSTAWAQTGFNPSTNASQNSFGYGAYVQLGNAAPYTMGNFNGTVENGMKNNTTTPGGVVNGANADEQLTTSSTDTRLIYLIRASSSSFTMYRDGSVAANFPKTSTSLTPYNGNMYLGALNSSGSAAFFGAVKCSFYIFTDGTLSSGDAANLASAIQTLHTSFGIQQ